MARVLTIEDDAVTAREIVTELKRRGNDVDWVDNGATGLDGYVQIKWLCRLTLLDRDTMLSPGADISQSN